MSLTSYQAAPPRILRLISIWTLCKSKSRSESEIAISFAFAAACDFVEP